MEQIQADRGLDCGESQPVSRFGKIKRKGQILKCLALTEQGLSESACFVCIFSLNPAIYEVLCLSVSLCLALSPMWCDPEVQLI